MRQNVGLSNHMKLWIGPYMIHVTYPQSNDEGYYFPDVVNEFMENAITEKPERAIHYIIDFGSYEVGPEDVPVAGYNSGPRPYQIYKRTSGEYLWIHKNRKREVKLVFNVSYDWKYWRLLYDNSNSQGMDSFTELSYIFPYSVLDKLGIMFHGVVMEWQGHGIIVCAHSGVGKTTHTRMWRDNENAVIINGDRALCYKNDGAWFTCGAPWCGSSGEYKSRSVKLTAAVILEQAENNQIKALPRYKGALELIKVAFAPTWEETLMNYAMDHVGDIVKNIPVFQLSCRPDLDSVALLKGELMGYMKRRKQDFNVQ